MSGEQPTEPPKRKSLELFAGAGGLGIGLSDAGFIPQIVVERDRWCCDTLRENHSAGRTRESCGGWRVVEDDIRRLDFRPFEGSVDLVSGGPPCQPFSMGGRHRANGDARDMFPEAVRVLREVKPKAFVFENVKGLMRASFQNYFSYVQLQMEHPEVIAVADEDWHDHYIRLEQHHTSRRRDGLHYKVVTRLLNAANFGVPQRRERVLFVGFRDDVDAHWTFGDGEYTHESLVWDQKFGTYWDRHNVASSERILEGRSAQIARRLSKNEKPLGMPWRTARDVIYDLPDPMHNDATNRISDHKFQPNARTYPGHTGS